MHRSESGLSRLRTRLAPLWRAGAHLHESVKVKERKLSLVALARTRPPVHMRGAQPIRPTAYVPLFAHISRRRSRACCVSCLNPYARPIGRALPICACLHPRRRGRCAAINLFAHLPLVALSNRKTGFDFLTAPASKSGDWVIDRQPPTRMIPGTDRPDRQRLGCSQRAGNAPQFAQRFLAQNPPVRQSVSRSSHWKTPRMWCCTMQPL